MSATPCVPRLALLFVIAAACSSSGAGAPASPSTGSGEMEEHARVLCPPTTPHCLAWDDFEAPAGPIVLSSSGQRWATWGLACSDCHPAFETDGARATMAPGSNKNSIWLATIDTSSATGVVVSATINLSPTPRRANVGLVALFADRMNHIGCKIEVSQGHPHGILAIGEERNGVTTSLLAERHGVGLVDGGTYHLELHVPSSLASSSVTCEVSGKGIRPRKVTYRLTAASIAAYGSGTGQGLRIKIFDDEDDGRSSWDEFEVIPIT